MDQCVSWPPSRLPRSDWTVCQMRSQKFQVLKLLQLQLTGLPSTPQRPAALTPVGDYVDTSTQAVPDAVLVLFLHELLPVAHPDPVAVLEELPSGLLPPSGVGQRLRLDASVRAAVR